MGEERKCADSYPVTQNIPFDTILSNLQIDAIQTYLQTFSQSYYIEMKFDNEDDFKESKLSVKQFCLFEFPSLNHDFTWVELIGQGSQASVELYKKK